MKESELLKSIKGYCQYMENLGRCIAIRNNSFEGWLCPPNKRPPEQYSPHYVKQGKKGSFDLILILKSMVVFIETKSKKGKLSKDQKEFKKKAVALGKKCIEVTDIEQVIELMK